VLVRRRFTVPLQVLEPMDLDGRGAATLMLLNPTGGIVGGDVLETRVTVGAGADVCLTTPAATRVYRSAGLPAVQRFTATVGEGARLAYVPDHLIPSPGARLRQTTEIALEPHATLLLADAWAVGRVARGERWQFDELDLALAIRDERGQILAERARLDRVARDGLGLAEGFAYVATFAVVAPDREDWEPVANALTRALAGLGGTTRAGVSALGRGGLVARALCASAPALDAAIAALWAACRRALFDLDPLHLRKL